MRNIISTLVLSCLLIFSVSIQAQDNELTIVASHSILADVVQNVSGDLNTVSSVMPIAADPHSFEASPSDLITVASADVVFVNGAFFEEGLLEAIENAGEDMNIVTASSCVDIIPIGVTVHDHSDHDDHGDEDHDHGDEDHDHGDEDHDHGDEDHDEHGDEDHDHEHGDEDHDEHGDEDHDHEHGDEDHDDHGDEDHDHEHSDEDHNNHGDEDHDHEHGDEDHDDHGDEDHEHGDEDHDEGMMDMDSTCDDHHSELGQSMMTSDALGRLSKISCSGGHGEGACDAHVWMDPHNVQLWTLLIRNTLSELDPDNAETYQQNAASYIQQLSDLDAEIVALVESLPAEKRILITNHDSLGYLANRFGFEIVGTVIPSGSTITEPSAQDIAGLIDEIREEGVPAIFGETTVSESIIQSVADETGAAVVVLYSGSLGDESSPASTYIDYIRYNYGAIVTALNVE